MEATRNTVLRLIESAVQAGELSAACTEYPESRAGLERAWEWHHARTGILAEEIAKAGPGKVPSVRMSGRLER